MSTGPHKVVSDENWSQLMTLASGYLALEDGDVQAAMGRAIAAHAQLIRALKAGRITADLPEGRVTMFVPETGGVALRTERTTTETPADAVPKAMADKLAAMQDLAGAPTVIDEQHDEPTDDRLPGIPPVPPYKSGSNAGEADDPTSEVTVNMRESNS